MDGGKENWNIFIKNCLYLVSIIETFFIEIKVANTVKDICRDIKGVY